MFNGSGGGLVEEAECVASVGQAVKWDREERQLPWYTERHWGNDEDNIPNTMHTKNPSLYILFWFFVHKSGQKTCTQTPNQTPNLFIKAVKYSDID